MRQSDNKDRCTPSLLRVRAGVGESVQRAQNKHAQVTGIGSRNRSISHRRSTAQCTMRTGVQAHW